MSTIVDITTVILFMADLAVLDLSLSRQGTLCASKRLDGIDAAIIEALLKLRFEPVGLSTILYVQFEK
ncbi:hypothetical protein D9M70_628900 [compost metagenome]